MTKRMWFGCGLIVLSLLMPAVAMEDGTKLVEQLKKHHLGKPYEGNFHMDFNTENNGIPVKATTQSQVWFQEPSHLAIRSTLEFEIPATPKQPETVIQQVHDGKRMWLDVKIPDVKRNQVLTLNLKHIEKVRNSQGQLSFMPGKPGAMDPMNLILKYLHLLPFKIEKTEGDWVTLFSEIPTLMWHQFGVVDPEGAKIDFSSVRIEANRKSNEIRALHIGKGEQRHMALTVKSFKQVAKSGFGAEQFRYAVPNGANINNLDTRLGFEKIKRPKAVLPQKPAQKEKKRP